MTAPEDAPEMPPEPRMLPVARQSQVTAVLALRPDGAPGAAPPLPTDGADAAGLNVAYLDDVIAGQPSGHLTGHLPAPGDLAAFVHTGGTAGAPKIAAHTHANQLEGYGLTEATCATTFTPPGEERPGSVGRALPQQQIKAARIGDGGSWTDCAPGETGLLVISGPTVFAGYVTEPGAGSPRVSPGTSSVTAG